jgi:hypothetical protein
VSCLQCFFFNLEDNSDFIVIHLSLIYGGSKSVKDVKLLVLISPPRRLNGATSNFFLNNASLTFGDRVFVCLLF